MNIKGSLKNLEIKFQQKNLLFISGNVYETFLVERKTFTLVDKLKDIVLKFNYESLIIHSPIVGSFDILKEKEEEEDANKDNINLCNFLNYVAKEISDVDVEKKVYLINLTDVYFDSLNRDIFIVNIAKILNVLLAKKFKDINEATITEKTSKIIFIMRDSGNILNLITNKNIEFANITIAKPDIEERKLIFKNHMSKFGVNDIEDLRIDGSQKQNQALALTNGLSYREILQLAKIYTPNDKDLSFKELFMLAQFNKEKSEWEKFDYSKIKSADNFLSQRVFGQEYAINNVIGTLKKSLLGVNGVMISDKLIKPKGILFFAGPTGVGKTELAKAITELIFGDESKLIRFDMSEFSQEHSDQRLIGAPPGYVGYDNGGELTNAIKENPYSILLFDEIEKAHKKILDKFLQILEDGRLTSAKGELINFSETMIIFTSNIGSSKVRASDEIEITQKKFKIEVEKHFREELKRPELLNRIGLHNIIPFNFIQNDKILKPLLKSKIKKLFKAVKEKHNINVIYKNSFEDLFDHIKAKYNPNNGGRGLIAAADITLTNALVDWIFDNTKENSKTLTENKLINIEIFIAKDKIYFKKKIN